MIETGIRLQRGTGGNVRKYEGKRNGEMEERKVGEGDSIIVQ